MGSDRFRQLVEPFAQALLPLVVALHDEDLGLTAYQRARLREAISVLVRKACDIAVPAAREPEVSVQAAQAAEALGVDLRGQSWQSQPSFDPGRVVFHYEHMYPVKLIVSGVVAASNADDIVDVLYSDLRIAWITKGEDEKLTSLGYKSNRPDPEAAYAEAGIVLTARGRVNESRELAPFPSNVNEAGFMPVQSGDAFSVVQLGLCIGGLIQIHSDAGSTVWSVGADTTLFDAQGRNHLARTRHGESGFREVGLLNANTGALLLQPRKASVSRDAGGSQELSFQAQAVQLAPPESARDNWSDELQVLLTRAVGHTLASGWQLRVETGGWDAPAAPFCSVEIAHIEGGAQVLYFEASPPPVDSRWWKNRMRPAGPDTVKLTLHAADFQPEQVALLLRDALAWDGITPWDLALTYAQPPAAVTRT